MQGLNSVHKQREKSGRIAYECAACASSPASFVSRPVILIILLGLRRWH